MPRPKKSNDNSTDIVAPGEEPKALKKELVIKQSEDTKGPLIVIEGVLTAQEVFIDDERIQKILQSVNEMAKKATPEVDVSTPAGREALRSAAFRVTKTRTALESLGKDWVAETKKKIGLVDVRRATLIKGFSQIEADIEGPATEWEANEDARKKGHEDRIEEMKSFLLFEGKPTSQDIEARIALTDKFDNWNFEEFKERFDQNKENVTERLSDLLNDTLEAEEDAAELARLRAKEAQQAEDDRIAEKAKELLAAQKAPEATPEPTAAAKTPEPTPEAKTAPATNSGPATAENPKAIINRGIKAAIYNELLLTLDPPNLPQKVRLEKAAEDIVKAIVLGKIKNVTINY